MNQEKSHEPKNLSLAEELGAKPDLKRTYFRKDGQEYSAIGLLAIPVVRVHWEGLDCLPVIYPADTPPPAMPVENISIKTDEHGIVLNELGEKRRIMGAKYKGHELYWLKETAPDSTRHYVAWFDESWNAHKLYMKNELLTTDKAIKLRNRTINGELSIIPELTSEE